MTFEELTQAVRELVGSKCPYFSVERSMRQCAGSPPHEYWQVAVQLEPDKPCLIVSEVSGPSHDCSSAESTLAALKQALADLCPSKGEDE